MSFFNGPFYISLVIYNLLSFFLVILYNFSASIFLLHYVFGHKKRTAPQYSPFLSFFTYIHPALSSGNLFQLFDGKLHGTVIISCCRINNVKLPQALIQIYIHAFVDPDGQTPPGACPIWLSTSSNGIIFAFT